MTDDRPDASDDAPEPTPEDERSDRSPDVDATGEPAGTRADDRRSDADDRRSDADDRRSDADDRRSDADDEPKLPTHVACALCYILSFASGIVMLMLEQEDRSVRFHAFQSILLGAVCLVLTIGVVVLGWIPPLGWLLGGILRWIVGFAWLFVSVFLMLKAYSGEDYRLPYLGSRASRLASPLD